VARRGSRRRGCPWPRRRGGGEVGAGSRPTEGSGGGVVGSRGGLGGVEGPQPDRRLLGGVPDLGGVAAGGSPPHAAVPDLRRRRGVRLCPAHSGGGGGWGGGPAGRGARLGYGH
jgi:hypothetical protein